MPPSDALADFLDALRGRVSGELRADLVTRLLYSTDASIYQALPYGVLLPRDGGDVQAAVELARAHRLPILARGGGSSLAGQTVNEALVLDFSRHLGRIVEVNAEERWARVEPGITLDALNRQLRPLRLQFGPDPASADRATIGGIVANNATGSHSLLYGMTADHLIAADVILSDGSRARFAPLDPEQLERQAQGGDFASAIHRRIRDLAAANRDTIRARTPRHWRRCGGYNLDRFVDGVSRSPGRTRDGQFNLAQLVCGSEGTLALMTEVTLNLVPLPAATGLALVLFDGRHEALCGVPAILQTDPAAVELFDEVAIEHCRQAPAYARLLDSFLPRHARCVLITEFQDANEAAVAARVAALEAELARDAVPCTVIPALPRALQATVWAVRKAGLGLIMRAEGDYKPVAFIEDAAVPVEHLPHYVRRIEEFCAELDTRLACYAHASAGCLHIRPFLNTKLASELAKLPTIASFAAELVAGYGGALSSEHGDGRTRGWLNERFFGSDLYALFREVKRAFDPEGILNPGMIVDAPQMTAHLRYGAGYASVPIETHLDFSRELGFDRAVEMCNGAGVCRKTGTGVMCPSFMVTGEEEQSTRGRANALRAILAGRLPLAELTGPRLRAVMDLCVQCKGCKSECPSSVDMAKLKVEYLAQVHDRQGVPLRSRVFGHIALLSRIASGAHAPVVNRLLATRPARWLLERGLGISRHRPLPPFARRPFTRWFAEHRGRRRPGQIDAAAPARPRVVLFNDTFNTYNYPQVAVAATEFLEAAGFEVILPRHKCCGRPMISKGLVAAARAAARDVVDRLAPFAEQGIPIVGLEPSCILTMRDEYFDLLPGDPRVARVAAAVRTFEEFVANLSEAGRLTLQYTAEERRVLLHAHCHQRALVGTGPAERALSLPPGYRVETVDSGCCGMAGAFGFEREHYEVSLAMAEQRLLPAIRQEPESTLIVAAGASCRQQIEHSTGRRVLHPAEALRDALREVAAGGLQS